MAAGAERKLAYTPTNALRMGAKVYETPVGLELRPLTCAWNLRSVFSERDGRLCLHMSSDRKLTPSRRSPSLLGQLWRADASPDPAPLSTTPVILCVGRCNGSRTWQTFKYLKANITSFPESSFPGRFLFSGLKTSVPFSAY